METHTDVFRKFLLSREICAWTDLEESLKHFQKETNTSFIISSCKRFMGDGAVRYHYVQYVCTFGRKRESEGIGMRRAHFKFLGCGAKFRVRFDGLRFRFSGINMDHSHPCSYGFIKKDPSRRRLTENDRKMLKPLIECRRPASEVIKYAHEQLGKPLKYCDVRHLRDVLLPNHLSSRLAQCSAFSDLFPRTKAGLLEATSLTPTPSGSSNDVEIKAKQVLNKMLKRVVRFVRNVANTSNPLIASQVVSDMYTAGQNSFLHRIQPGSSNPEFSCDI